MKLNNRGFTLVEMLAVVALLGLLIGIATPNIMKSQKKAKERLLSSKVKNIEKAAVLWGQDHKERLTRTTSDSCGGVGYNCAIINVKTLVTGIDDNATATEKIEDKNNINTYMNYDEGAIVKNPINDKDMSECNIYVYKKYGKVHAVYKKNYSNNDLQEKCWVKK